MDPVDNPLMVKRPTEHPAAPANEPKTCQAQENDSHIRPDTNPNVEAIDDARREKIQSLKNAVADGTYTVSDEEVARKLIEHMLEPKE